MKSTGCPSDVEKDEVTYSLQTFEQWLQELICSATRKEDLMPRQLLKLALLAVIGFVSTDARADDVDAWIDKNIDQIVGVYRELHARPELSFQEKETAARLSKELREAGVDVTENVGGYGVVGVLKNGAGKTVLIRTDLDALPVTEATELAYASKVRVKGTSGGR
jgi:hypothetical protein